MSVYNGPDYLAEAIQSVLDQRFTEFEFLIIDDGSTEPLDPVLSRFTDDRIRLVRQENIGLTRSLNRGLLLARGAYVARMDGDDVSLPGRLEAQIGEFERDPRLDLVGCFFDVVNAAGRVTETKELITDPIYRLWRLQFHNNYGHGAMMYRKQAILDAGQYNENLKCAQDFDLWSRVSRKRNTKIVPEVLYQYRMVAQGSQASVKNYAEQLATAVAISNRSLMACNRTLSEDDCEEVRALYWKFRRESVSFEGLVAIPDTLGGFCWRYGLDTEERARLIHRVALDALEEIESSSEMTMEQRGKLTRLFLTLAANMRQRVRNSLQNLS